MSEHDRYDGGDDLSSLLDGDDDTLIAEIEKRRRKKKAGGLGVVTPGPIKPLGIEAKEVARLATEGPLSQRIAASFTIGKNDDLAKRAAPIVRKRTAPNLPEALADVALGQLPSILGPGGERAAEENAEHTMDRYAEGGGDPGAHATLFGLAGAGGAVGANVGVFPSGASEIKTAARELGEYALTRRGAQAALEHAAKETAHLPQTLAGRAVRASKQGAATMGGLSGAGGATFGNGDEGPGVSTALEEAGIGATEGMLMGAAAHILPEAGAKFGGKAVEFLKGLELSNRSGSLGGGRKVGDPFSRSRVMGTNIRTPSGEMKVSGDLPISRDVPVIPAAVQDQNLERVAQSLTKRLGTHGGFTFDPHSGKFVSSGYAVALGKQSGVEPLVVDQLTPDAIKQFLSKNGQFFADNPDVKIGAWRDGDTGKIYLEPSEVKGDRRAAVALGVQRGELAVGDLAKYAKGQNGDIPLELQRFEHRSPVAGLTELSGKFQGTNPGVTGAERARPKRTGRVYVQDPGSQLEPEFRNKSLNLYHVDVPKGQLYDVSTDPDGIVARIGGRDPDRWEKAIEKAGYAGYYASEFNPHYKALFGETPVVGAPKETPVTPIAPTRPVSQPRTGAVPSRTVDEVAELAVRGRKSLENEGYGVQIKEAVKRGLTDVLDALEKVPHAREWYKADLARMDDAVKGMLPETNDPTRMQLFRAVLAITSSGQKPVGNFKSALALTRKFFDSGENLDALSFFNGPARKIKTPKGGWVYSGQVDKSIPSSPRFNGHEDSLIRLRSYLGNDKTQWGQKLEQLWAERINTTHRQAHTGETVDVSMPLASRVLGKDAPKIGRFYANLSGVAEDVTVDVWAARTLRRWLGYARTGSESAGAPTDVEGNVMRAAIAQLAQKATAQTGQRFDPMDIQALLWYYEKQRFADLGARDSGQISYADAAEFVRRQSESPAGNPGLGAPAAGGPGGEGPAAYRGAAPGALAYARAAAPDRGAGPRAVPGEPAGQPGGGAAGYSAGDRGGLDPARAGAAQAAAPFGEVGEIGYEGRGIDLNTARLQNMIDLQRGADLGDVAHLFSDLREGRKPAEPPLRDVQGQLLEPPQFRGQQVDVQEFVRGLTRDQREILTRELRGQGEPRLKNRGGYLDLSGRKPNEEPESIVAPAIQTPDGRIFQGALHILAREEARKAGALPPAGQPWDGPGTDGFLTSTGRFVDRKEAQAIHARNTGDNYYSEFDALDLPESQRAGIEPKELDATDLGVTPLDEAENAAQWAENVRKQEARFKNRPGFLGDNPHGDDTGSPFRDEPPPYKPPLMKIDDNAPKAKPVEKQPWNPVEKPFRVEWRGRYQGVGQWASRVETFATEDEARAAAQKPFGAGIIEAVIDRAQNPETWQKNGSWQRIGGRRRGGMKNRPGFLSLGSGRPPALQHPTEGTGTPYKAPVDVTEDPERRALANIAKLNLSPEAEAKVRDAYQRLDLSKKTVTHEETQAVANELGLDPQHLLGKEGRLSGAELLAVRDVISSNAQRIVDLSSQAQDPKLSIPERESILNEVGQLTGQNDEFLKRYTKAREQTGRDLNALRIIARNSLDAPTWLLQAERLKGLPLTQDEHVLVSRLAQEKDRDGLIRAVSAMRKSSPQDKLVTLWKAGLLTSLGTHIANVSGNAAMAATESVKDVPAAMVDALISLARGTERTKAPSVRGLVTEPIKGFFGPGMRAAKRALQYGPDPSDVTKWDFRRTNYGDSPAGRIAQAYTDAVFNSLGAEDQAFKAAAVGRSLEEQARLAAKGDKALRAQLRKQPTPQMMVQAIADAEVATFQNPNLAADAVSGMRQKLRSKGPAGETAATATELVAPFVKTPSNIVARTIEYSPPGLLYHTAKLGKALASDISAPDQKKLAEALGRGIVGSSSLFLLGFMLAREGKATGSAPKTPNERSQWDLEGKVPNGIKVGDTWRSFARLGPPGMVVATGAQAYDAFANSETTSGKIFGALYAPIRAGLDQSFLQGPSGALDALNDPLRAGEKFASSTIGSVIPAGVAQAARASDPYARETKGILPTVEGRIPGLRQTLPARLNAFGHPIREGTTLSDLFDPTRPTPASKDPLIKALADANVNVGFPSRVVSGPNKTRRQLSDQEYRALVQEVGPRTENALRDLMEQGLFTDARESPDTRRDIAQERISKVRGNVNRARRRREAEQATASRR